MKRIVVFMYHGLYDGEPEFEHIERAERAYAVSVTVFAAALDGSWRAASRCVTDQSTARAAVPDQAVLLRVQRMASDELVAARLPLLRDLGLTRRFCDVQLAWAPARLLLSWAAAWRYAVPWHGGASARPDAPIFRRPVAVRGAQRIYQCKDGHRTRRWRLRARHIVCRRALPGS